jgi:tetratricopeptide (TPR) repeat protein
VTDYTEAIRRDPKRAAAYVNRGVAYHFQKNLPAAIADYDTAVGLDFGVNHLPAAWFNRGVALYEQKIGEGIQTVTAAPIEYSVIKPAIADLSQAIALDPKNADAYYNRGVAHFAQSNMAAALADFKKVLDLDPDNADARRYRDLAQQRRR